MAENKVQLADRIMSVDALRGFDMLMIIFAGQFIRALDQGADMPFTNLLAQQFDHPEWFGFHVWDIIMPLFLFVVGAVIPFSIHKRLEKDASRPRLYKHLFRRFFILFVLGWIVQGQLLNLDINEFHIFCNTLQAIAVGYLFSSLAYLHLSKKGRYILFAACLVVYAILLTVPHVPGVGRSMLLPDKNFALYVDRLIMGRFEDGTQYTWILSSFGFTATVLSGLFAGEIIRSGLKREKIAFYLLIIGLTGVALGLIWGIWHPIVKKLWTSSFVLFSSGLSYLLLAMFYWVIDVKGYRKWAFFLKVIGMNAIFAYMVSHTINLPDIAGNLLFGLEQYVGNYYRLVIEIGGFVIIYLLLWYLYKNRTFIKV
jgi:predicted acyltransferase